jgi:pimeloyl-ACP methyl ester carboxylesterase
LPSIGRLRPQPWWRNNGPQAAAGLIVWSHGYKEGTDSTSSAPQPHVGRFLAAGYDLYRFDRRWIRDWAGDASAFADSVRQARSLGYRRIVLAGQSNGAWQSLAAAMRGAPVDGVISMAAAINNEVRTLRDPSVPRSEFAQIVRSIKPGPRVVLVNFADDVYDVGGRMADAQGAFTASGVDAVVLDNPAGFKGHGAANEFAFARKYGACIKDFIESGRRSPPCS